MQKEAKSHEFLEIVIFLNKKAKFIFKIVFFPPEKPGNPACQDRTCLLLVDSTKA